MAHHKFEVICCQGESSRWSPSCVAMDFLMCKLSHCRSPIGGLPKLLSPKLMYGCTPLDLPIQVGFSIP